MSRGGTRSGPSFHAAHGTLPAGLLGKQRRASSESWLHRAQGSTPPSLYNSEMPLTLPPKCSVWDFGH